MSARNKPRRRKKGLAVQKLAKEVLVYDLERHRAHCLNEAAALVWRQCDGETSVSDIALNLREKLDVSSGTGARPLCARSPSEGAFARKLSGSYQVLTARLHGTTEEARPGRLGCSSCRELDRVSDASARP